MDDSKTSFRNKVKSKFSSQIVKAPINVKGKESIKPTYISSLLPPIPVKSSKKVNKIFKYFKTNSLQDKFTLSSEKVLYPSFF